MEHKLFVKYINHNFGERNILSHISFECKTGEVLGMFGRNGTGKSTIFKILFGALKPNQAEIYFDGQLFQYGSQINAFIGYHSQEIMLPKSIKVRKLISIYIPVENQNNVYYSSGINDMLDKHVQDLSIGLQRYLQLLLLLNLNHPILLLDEPFSMVEPLYKDLIKELILAYKSHKGFIITDHYYLDVLEVSDQILLLKEGRLNPIVEKDDLIGSKYLSEKSILY